MIFPAAPDSDAEPRPTGLYAAAASESVANRWVSVSGRTMALSYTRVLEEYTALTENVGVFDLGAYCRYTVRGPDAGNLIGRLTSAPVADLGVGETARGLILTEGGRVIDQCDVLRLTKDLFFLTTAAPINRRLQLAARDAQVDIDERTDAVAALGLLGPNAATAAQSAGFDVPAELIAVQGRVRGVETAIRTISLGTIDGVEILYPAEEALILWERVRRSAAPQPIGLDAMEIVRIAAGAPRLGLDYASATAGSLSGHRFPVEIGLPHLAPTNRAWFNGRRSLYGQSGERRLVTLVLDADDITNGASVINLKGEAVGVVTSSAFSPSHRAAICFVDIARAAIMDTLSIRDQRGAVLAARFLETHESGQAAAFRARENNSTESRGRSV